MFIDSLIEICSWDGVIGWQGLKCSKCGATHNALMNIPGILCEECGEFIGTSMYAHRFCYRKPNYGFNRSVIGWAMINFSPHKAFFKPQTVKLYGLLKHKKQ
jgi:hypothetical protein